MITRSFDCETLVEALNLMKRTKALEALELDFSVHLRKEEREYENMLGKRRSEAFYVVDICVNES